MKRLSKILMLVLVVALTLGCVFVIAASATDLPAGVTPSTTAFDADSTPTTGWNQISFAPGTQTLHQSYGGNHYAAWTLYDPSSYAVADNNYRHYGFNLTTASYYIIEMDLATKTEFPEGFQYSWEANGYDTNYVSAKSNGGYPVFFTVSGGKITGNGVQVEPAEDKDWTHLSIVIQLNSAEKEGTNTSEETVTYSDFSNVKVNLYADGKLVYSTSLQSLGGWANFSGITNRDRWGFFRNDGSVKNNQPGTNISWDNWTITTVSKDSYEDSGDAYLAQLFNGTVTNLTDYAGTEVKYNKDGYEYPENISGAYVTKTVTKNGTPTTTQVGVYKTLAHAVEAVNQLPVYNTDTTTTTYDVYLLEDEGIEVTTTDATTGESTTTYYGLPAAVAKRAMKIHTNGKLCTAPTVAGIVTGVAASGEGTEKVYTYTATDNYVSFYYYGSDATVEGVYNEDVDCVAFEDVIEGFVPTAPAIGDVYDAATGKFALFEGWKYYTRNEDEECMDLIGDTCPEITSALYKQGIYVIPTFITSDPLFTIDGTPYARSSDLTAANVNGKTVKLLADVKLVNTLSNVKVDLNGYTLDCGATTLVNGKGTTSFFYTSREGGKLLSTGTLHSTDGADTLAIGYSSATFNKSGYMTEHTTSPYRITMVVGLIAPYRNDRTFMYGCDVITTRAWISGDKGDLQGGALFYNAQARTKIVRIDNCNFYCAAYTHVFSAHATSSFDAVVTNTNFYGNGQMISKTMWNDNNLSAGAMVIKLENVHTYGDFKVDTALDIFQVEVGVGCSFSNYTDKAIKSIADGYVLFPSNDKVTLADVTYVTTIGGETLTFVGGEFAVGNAVIVEPPKTVVNVYDKAYGNDGATANEMNAYVGYAPAFPAIGSYGDNVSVSVPTGNYVLYDANGVKVGTIAIGAEWTQDLVDKGVVAAYPEVTKKATAFAIVGADGALDYKAADEFTAANVANKTVKLYSDLTISAAIGGITIDLNGYNLTVNAQITNNRDQIVKIYNSNAEKTPTIYMNSVLAGGSMYVKARIGDAANYPDNRITVVAKTGFIAGGNMFSNEVTLYNVDLVNTENTGNLLGTMRGNSQYTATNCNFYVTTSCNLVYVDKSQDGAKVTLTNCNFYYQNGGTFGGAVTRESDKFQGIASMVLNNTKVYGAITPANDKWSFTIGKDCVFGAVPYANGKATVNDGYVVLPQANSTTVSFTYTAADGTEAAFSDEFVANYAVVVEPAKNVVTVYDKAYGVEGATGNSLNMYVGYVPNLPAYGSYFVEDEETLYMPTGVFALYDEAGVKVGEIKIGDVFSEELCAKNVVAAYPVVEEAEIAFVIEGVGPKAAEEFTAANVNGKKVTLWLDVTVNETLSNVTIDLSGCNLTFATAQLTSGSDCFIYNSNTETSATIYAGKPLGGGKDTVTYIGYSDASTKAAGRITVVALVNNLTSAGMRNHARYYNVDFVATAGCNDNTTLLGQIGDSAEVIAESCNFYFTEGGVVAHAWASSNATLTLTNCNVYFTKGGTIVGGNYKSSGGAYGPAYVNLVGTKVYGFVYETHGGDWNFNIDADSTLGGTPFAAGNAGAGNVLVPVEGATAEPITFSYIHNGEEKVIDIELWSSAKMGTQAELNALYAKFYRNVSLDVSINFNLYVPVTVGVMDADTVKINGVDYYVVTYGQAAKDAYGDNWVNVNINGVNYAYNASLVSYVTALNNVQSTDDYVVASKKLAQYVVYYVKTAALNANAEAVMPEAVETILAGFALTEADTTVTGAIENVASINGVTGATLDLAESVGMVVRIADDFVGTITVSMDGAEPVSVTYEVAETDEEKLGKRYIVISNIAAFDFTNDVVITNDAGETMTYNLATYVANKTTDIGYATYAYAVQAKAYNDTYGAAKVVD